MIRLDVQRVLSPGQATEVVGETVETHEPSDLKPGTVVYDRDTGEPILGYMKLGDPGPLRRALLQVDCSGGVQRQKNYRSRSRTFGYSPRRPIMGRESCSLTSISVERPDIARTVEGYADQFSGHLKAMFPEVVDHCLDELSDVLPDWRIGEAKLWTSGVINDTAQLPYHRDGFNFPTWSAMPVLRRGTRGGHLHLPEYGLTIPCGDSTVTYFEGHRYVHGVTPIQRVKAKEGYRISVVYYALKGMLNCREYAEEQALGRKRRTDREAEMAKRLAAGDRTIPTGRKAKQA